MTNTDGHTSQDIAGYQVLLGQRDAEIARQSAELLARDLLIEKLKLQLANLRRQRFGTKSVNNRHVQSLIWQTQRQYGQCHQMGYRVGRKRSDSNTADAAFGPD